MRLIPEFPEHRRQDPMRQAELAIYNQVEASKADGGGGRELRHRS